MTDRPDGGDSSRPDDGQWRPVDPPTEAAGPYQPNPYPQQNPPTRAYDPYAQQDPYAKQDPYGYQQQPYGQQDPYAGQGPVYGGPAYGPTQQFQGGPGGPGYPPPGYGQGYGEPVPAGGPPPPNGGNTSRTLWLITAVVALIVVVALVAGYFLVSRSNSEDEAAAAASSSSSEAPLPDNLFPTFADPSGPQGGGGQTSASPTPGQILYALSGNGQVLGVTFASGTTLKVSPTLITPPWSVAADVDGDPSLTAVVLSGSVTCTISRDGQELTTATSSTGLLRCAAPAG